MGEASAGHAATQDLLLRWHGGDEAALAELLRRHLPWIQQQVSRRLGPALRARAETVDFVQEAFVRALRVGPRFVLEDGSTFRRLMVRLIENVLRDQADFFRARRRAMQRERPLPSDTVLGLDAPCRAVTRPDEAAERAEAEARVRLALELLPEADRRMILRREWDGAAFAEIAAELGLQPDAARMRFHRALVRLTRAVELLEASRIDALLEPGEPEAEP